MDSLLMIENSIDSKKMNDCIISVNVITYNSSTTVLETLNSILVQDYGSHNIELVISDDFSTDNTCEIITNWLNVNTTSFMNVIFNQNASNLGIPSNCSIAWKNSSGKWIKTIAGDDLLTKDCISNNLHFVSINPEASCVFSNAISFGEKVIESKLNTKIKNLNDMNPFKQFLSLCIGNFLLAPTSFIRNDLLKEIGYADAGYTLIEDYPLWLKITAKGYKLFLNPSYLVLYRLSESVSQTKFNIINVRLANQLQLIDKCYILNCQKTPFIYKFIVRQDSLISKMLCFLAVFVFKNKRSLVSTIIIGFIRVLSVRYVLKKFR